MVDVHGGGSQGRVNINTTSSSGNIDTTTPSTNSAVETTNNQAKYWSEKAQGYANQANSSATSASNSATSASTSASTATTKATEASNSATSASTSASNASTSEDNAETWAEGTDAEVQALGGTHSAKGWQTIIENSAPTATVTKSGIISTLTVTDKNGTTTTAINDGSNGSDGTSVTGVSLISTVGLDKTYRMSFSNDTHFDYVVSNGASGSTQWGGILGTLSNQTDLQTTLNGKQDTLTAGSNIQINNNTISATDTTYTGGTNISIGSDNKINFTGTIPTKTSDLTNDSGYITSSYHDSTKQDVATYDSTNERLVL